MGMSRRSVYGKLLFAKVCRVLQCKIAETVRSHVPQVCRPLKQKGRDCQAGSQDVST